MCNTENSRQERIRKARKAAAKILNRSGRTAFHKSWSLDTPRDFDRAVLDLAARLLKHSSASDTAALRDVIDELDVDWHSTTAAQRSQLINDALVAAGRATAMVPAEIKVVFDDAAEEVVRVSRDLAKKKHNLAIAADFNAIDKRVITHLKNSEANFVRDEYGKRLADFGRVARSIVAAGVKDGLGNNGIAKQLNAAATDKFINRSQHYWNVVSNSFIGRGRTFSTLSAFKEAGIEKYVFEAVLDEATTDVCRFYHGKVFTVDRGLELFDQVEANPESIKDITPWARKSRDEDGTRFLYVKQNGRVTRIADIVYSGFGNRDVRGTFSNGKTTAELSEIGLVMPPLHGLCRSNCLPIK